MLHAYYICCKNAPQNTFSKQTNTMNPDQTVPKGYVQTATGVWMDRPMDRNDKNIYNFPYK